MAVTGKTQGLRQEVLTKLNSISKKLGRDVNVISGFRNGPIDDSAHNSGIAVDIQISGMLSVAIADELVLAGFSGIGEYYRKDNCTEQTNTAHGDIRGQIGSEHSGAYAPGGVKSAKLCWYRCDKTYSYGSRLSGHSCP